MSDQELHKFKNTISQSSSSTAFHPSWSRSPFNAYISTSPCGLAVWLTPSDIEIVRNSVDQSTCLGVFSLESPLFHSLKPRCYISSAYSYRLQMSFIATSFLIPLSSSSFASVSIRLLLFLLFFRFNSHAFGLSNTQNVNALIWFWTLIALLIFLLQKLDRNLNPKNVTFEASIYTNLTIIYLKKVNIQTIHDPSHPQRPCTKLFTNERGCWEIFRSRWISLRGWYYYSLAFSSVWVLNLG